MDFTMKKVTNGSWTKKREKSLEKWMLIQLSKNGNNYTRKKITGRIMIVKTEEAALSRSSEKIRKANPPCFPYTWLHSQQHRGLPHPPSNPIPSPPRPPRQNTRPPQAPLARNGSLRSRPRPPSAPSTTSLSPPSSPPRLLASSRVPARQTPVPLFPNSGDEWRPSPQSSPASLMTPWRTCTSN